MKKKKPDEEIIEIKKMEDAIEYLTYYICMFKDMADVERSTTIPDISTAKEGFWVNFEFKFTNASDNVFWVPPTRVLGVMKMRSLPKG